MADDRIYGIRGLDASTGVITTPAAALTNVGLRSGNVQGFAVDAQSLLASSGPALVLPVEWML